MINLGPIRCSLAFAPYLLEALNEFATSGSLHDRVVKQAGSGLIIRKDTMPLIRYQNRELHLDDDAVSHYIATIRLRSEHYGIRRTSDEVIIAGVCDTVLISHPQSELWLDQLSGSSIVSSFDSEIPAAESLPAWLTISTMPGRLLLSDQRTGRWVLLSQEHVTEISERLSTLSKPSDTAARVAPKVELKGIPLPLQLVFAVLAMLDAYSKESPVIQHEWSLPEFRLSSRLNAGTLELSDGNVRVAISRREAVKWVQLLEAELERYGAVQIHRGQVETTFANVDTGTWVLQGGDEVLLKFAADRQTDDALEALIESDRLVISRGDALTLILDSFTGACVGLSSTELKSLTTP